MGPDNVRPLKDSAPAVSSTASGNTAVGGSFMNNAPFTNQGSITFVASKDEPTVEERQQQCLAALHVTDPESDHRSILTCKGNLVMGTCRWIKDVTEFQSWLTGTTHLLWISGGPGKGKTFLSIHLVETLPGLTKKSATDDERPLVLRYFCDNSDNQRNTALAVVRGLLYQILVADQARYDDILRPFELRQAKGENLFTEAHIEELWGIFEKMVAKLRRPVYLLLDGLDECDPKSINFLNRNIERTSTPRDGYTKWRIKTVVVSRPNVKVPTDLRIDLDREHSQSTVQDVTSFVQARVKDIHGIGQLQPALERVLLDRAGGTFLWVWLATSMLKDHPEQAQEILQSKVSANVWLPKGLDAMYEQMLLGIRERDAEAAAAVLRHIAMASRPLTRGELRDICTGIKDINTDLQIDVSCRNLLTFTGHTVQLVHLSLKEYLVRIPRRNLSASVTRFFRPSLLAFLRPLLRLNKLYLADRLHSALPLFLLGLLSVRRYAGLFSNIGVAAGSFCYMLLPTRRTMVVYVFGVDERKVHGELLLRCLELMGTLRKNGCKLNPGTLAAKVDNDKVNQYLPSHVQYACLSWVYHLGESQAKVRDGDRVHQFLKCHFLHWLEALSLLGRASESISLVRTLQGLLQREASAVIASFLADAARFVQTNIAIISKAPFQTYTSALAFAPKNSILKETFWNAIPPWLSLLPKVESDWGACLKTLEGHNDYVESAAFSHDAKLVVSGSQDCTIKIWDVATGADIRTLTGHESVVTSVAFSYDAKLVVSGSGDGTLKVWDIATGADIWTLTGHGTRVKLVAFSYDAKLVVSGSMDRTIKIWDAATGANVRTLTDHEGSVSSVAYSDDAKLVVSGSMDRTIKIWDVAAGADVRMRKDHKGLLSSVAYSDDAKLVVSGSWDGTIKIWDIKTGADIRTLMGHEDVVTSVGFSYNAKLVASGSWDRTIKIWNVATGADIQMLIGHEDVVLAVAFSDDAKLIVSGSWDGTIKIWDVTTGADVQTLTGHRREVKAVAFSDDAKLVVSGSEDCAIKIWDVATGANVWTLTGHESWIESVAFSDDAKLVVSGSWDGTIKIWDAATGTELKTLQVGTAINSLSFHCTRPYLRTNIGLIGPLDRRRLGEQNEGTTSFSGRTVGYGVSSSRAWITWDGEDVLWLPPECRPVTSVIAAEDAASGVATGITARVALGCASGRVIILGFLGAPVP